MKPWYFKISLFLGFLQASFIIWISLKKIIDNFPNFSWKFVVGCKTSSRQLLKLSGTPQFHPTARVLKMIFQWFKLAWNFFRYILNTRSNRTFTISCWGKAIWWLYFNTMFSWRRMWIRLADNFITAFRFDITGGRPYHDCLVSDGEITSWDGHEGTAHAAASFWTNCIDNSCLISVKIKTERVSISWSRVTIAKFKDAIISWITDRGGLTNRLCTVMKLF